MSNLPGDCVSGLLGSCSRTCARTLDESGVPHGPDGSGPASAELRGVPGPLAEARR